MVTEKMGVLKVLKLSNIYILSANIRFSTRRVDVILLELELAPLSCDSQRQHVGKFRVQRGVELVPFVAGSVPADVRTGSVHESLIDGMKYT